MSVREEARSAPKPRRRWMRRIGYVLAALLLLVVVGRIALPFALPSILNSVAGDYGLRCDYERLSLSILTGDVELWHLTVRPEEGGTPYVDLEYARVDIDVSSLLSSQPVIRRVEVDGLDLHIHRQADGKFAFERHFSGLPAQPEESPDPKDVPEELPDAFDLRPPVRVEAFRVQHVQLHLRDDFLPPTVEARYEFNARISNLGHPERETRFALTLTSPDALDALSIEGRAQVAEREFNARADVRIWGWKPGAYRGEYLKQFGIVPRADEVDGRLELVAEGRPSGPEGKCLALAVMVQGVDLLADRESFLSLERLGLRAEALRPDALMLDFVGVQGVRARLGLSSEGALEVGPFRFLQPESLEEPARSQGLAGLLAMARTRVDTQFGNAGVREVRVRDATLELHDASMPEPVDLSVALEELRLRGEAVDAALGARRVTLSAAFSVPSVVDRIGIEGTLDLLRSRKTFELDLAATGIDLEGVAPYLARVGAAATFREGAFTCKVTGSIDAEDPERIRASAAVENMRLEDRDGEVYFSLASGRLQGYEHALGRGTVGVDEIVLDGFRLTARRNGDVVSACGLRFGPGATDPAPALPPPTPATRPEPAVRALPAADLPEGVVALRRITVNRLAYDDVKITLADETEKPSRVLDLGSGGELRELTVPLSAASEPLVMSQITGWCSAPGVMERTTMNGSVGLKPGAFVVDLGLRTEGLTGRFIRPYLRPLGLDPVMTGGVGEGRLNGSVRFGDDGVTADLVIENVRLVEGDEELVASDRICVRGVALANDEVRVGEVLVERPRIRVHRDANGALRTVGIRTVPPPAAPKGIAPKKVATKKSVPAAPLPADDASPLVIRVNRFRVTDATAAWRDHHAKPEVALDLTTTVDLSGIVLGRTAPPAKLECRFTVPGMIETGGVQGTLRADPVTQGFGLDVVVDGICFQALGPYITSSSARSIRSGRFRARVEGMLSKHGRTGSALEFGIRAVDFRDGADGPSLLALEALRVRVPNLDPLGGRIDIEEVTVVGLESRLERMVDGGLRPCGIRLPEPQPGETVEASAPVIVARGAPARPRRRVGPWPQVNLKKLDLNLRRFTIIDRRFPEAEPLVLSNVRLHNPEPIRVLGENAEANKPTRLRLEGGVRPLAERFKVDLTATPFDARPGMRLVITASGVDGSGITRVRPDLQVRLDGQPLKDGRFEMTASLVLRRRARHALDFDLARGFGLAFELRDVAFRNGDGGPPLAGVGEVDIDVKSVNPATGAVHIESIEIGKPVGRVRLDEDGLHAMGLVIKLPAGKAPAPAETVAAPAAPASPAKRVAMVHASNDAARKGAAPPTGEIRLDRFTVSDLDFLMEDATVDPPFRLPLEDLDIEMRGFTTRLWEEKKPLRFQMRLGAGAVDLSRKKSDTPPASAESGGLDEGAAAKKPVFQEMLVRGEFFFSPSRHGWIKANLSMVELGAFRGPAAGAGVEIHEGLFDADALVLLREDGRMDVDADLAFTGLSMAEPADGLISRYLALPAPLDTVIFFIRDENGTINLPLSFTLDAQGGVSSTQIAQKAVTALGVVIANAVAASPFRLVGTVTDPLGLGGGDQGKAAGEPLTIAFSTGAVAVGLGERAPFAPLIERLRREPNLTLALRAELGRSDLDVARNRGNPSRADCLALIGRLRDRRERLFAFREVMLRRGRAALAARLDTELDETIARLRAYDLELARIETSLDRLGELIRTGSERLAPRRTRAAAVAIAEARLIAVKNLLIDAVGPEIEHRITVSRPRFRPDTDLDVGVVVIQPTISTLKRRKAPESATAVTPGGSVR